MESKGIRNDNQLPQISVNLDHVLLIEIPDLQSRIKSVVVGMEHYKYIIVKIPTNDLIGVFNRKEVTKNVVTVMYRFKGAVYKFDTTIQNVVNFPDRLLFLKYPKEVNKHCVPEKIRYKCNLPSQTMIGNDIVEMDFVDISQNGCLCIIKTAWEDDKGLYELIHIDQKLDIQVQFPGSEERDTLVGLVRHLSKDIDKIHLGIMFDSMPTATRDRLDNYVATLSKAGEQE